MDDSGSTGFWLYDEAVGAWNSIILGGSAIVLSVVSAACCEAPLRARQRVTPLTKWWQR